jgi:hypothetical protein
VSTSYLLNEQVLLSRELADKSEDIRQLSSRKRRKTVQYACFALKAVERVCIGKSADPFYTKQTKAIEKNPTRFAGG